MRVINLTADGGWQRVDGEAQFGAVVQLQARTSVAVLVRQFGADDYFTVKSGTVLSTFTRSLGLLEVQAQAGTVIEIIV